jgi:tetratricopeptide (TPR) repeat protein
LNCQAAGDQNDYWKKGNDYYQQKQYDSAAYYFEQIATLKPRNAEVYYNLGNTYYRLNRISFAVLNYERALRTDPSYKDAKDNLLLAQSRISNYIPATEDIFFVNWWRSLTSGTKATAWSVCALICFILIIGLLSAKRMEKLNISLPPQFTGLLGFLCGCFLLLAFAASRHMEVHNRAVVMQNDAPLMNNEQKGKPLILVPEGTTVKIQTEKGTWAEVALPDGRSGWIELNLINKI